MAMGQRGQRSHFAIQLLDCLQRESRQGFDLGLQAQRLADCMIANGFPADGYRGSQPDPIRDSEWLAHCIVVLANSQLGDPWPCTVHGFDADFIDYACRCLRRTLNVYQALWGAYIADAFAQHGFNYP
jgi:hypothetical protein